MISSLVIVLFCCVRTSLMEPGPRFFLFSSLPFVDLKRTGKSVWLYETIIIIISYFNWVAISLHLSLLLRPPVSHTLIHTHDQIII